VVSRLTTDTEDFSNVIGLVVDFLSQLVLVAVFFSYLVSLSFRMALMLLVMAPIAAVLALAFLRIARFVTLDAKRVTAQVNSRIQESVSGIGVAKGLFIQAVGFFWWPMLNIASFRSQLQGGLAAAERVFSLIDREPRVRQTGERSPARIEGKVEFRDLRFAYSSKETVFDGLSLAIAAGEKLAIVGKTGAGKSSIVKLLCRFYEFQAGEILVDGLEVCGYRMDALRASLGLVSQDPFLFPGTVADSIRYAGPEASDAEVEAAARSLGSGDRVEDLPSGLATETGHRGSSLSMGQRQLVALARVLLRDPRIFILDEATSSVEPFTEAQIQEGLETIMRDRTAIVIAHRLSTVKFADRIVVLHAGSIVEEGSHEALLDRGGEYATLYDTCFRHQSLEYIERQSR